MDDRKQKSYRENSLEAVLQLICYIALPLISLIALTIGMSLLTTGGLNTDVNEAEGFLSVLLSFSLPMVLALAVLPVTVKVWGGKCSLNRLGFRPSTPWWNIVGCGAMTVGTVVLAVMLGNNPDVELSAWTVWSHFFFVAVAEECMLRGVVHDQLRNFTENKWVLCLLNGLIFAFVYHSNEDFLSNLLVRVPLGFILCFVRVKSDSLYPAITLHWLYNMAVTTI